MMIRKQWVLHFTKSKFIWYSKPLNIFNCVLYFRLNEITEFHLPISQIIHQTLTNLLKSRISSANRYVLNIFIDEYHVFDHMFSLQKIYFLGAGDLMQTFYSNLFKSVSSLNVFRDSLTSLIKIISIFR